MTREEFKRILDKEIQFYKEEGDKIVFKGSLYKWDIFLNYLTSLLPGVIFENRGILWLNSVRSIPSGVEFRNEGAINLETLLGGWADEWEGNIEGISPNRLLNKMVSDGLFDKEKK